MHEYSGLDDCDEFDSVDFIIVDVKPPSLPVRLLGHFLMFCCVCTALAFSMLFIGTLLAVAVRNLNG